MELIKLVKLDIETVKGKDLVVISAMVCITILEACAISQGINGALLGTVVAVLASLGTYYKVKPKE